MHSQHRRQPHELHRDFAVSVLAKPLLLGSELTSRGCKPKPPKIPSPQFQPRHDRIQVDELSVAAEGVVPVQVDVAPRRRRQLRDQRQGFRVAARLILREQPRQDGGVVIDDRVRDQPRALVAG
jgi:hypothetical protein